MASTRSEFSELDPARLLEGLAVAADQAGLGFAVTEVSVEPPRVVYASSGTARISGRSVEAILSGSIFESIPSDEQVRVRELVQLRRESNAKMLLETVLVTPEGERVPIELGTTGMSVGERQFAVTLIRDISERRQTQQALQQSEQRFRFLVEHGPDGVVILRGVTVVYMSPRAAKLLELERPEDAIGKPIIQFLSPEEGVRTQSRLAEIESRKSPLDPAEYRFHASDGSTRFVEVSSVPVEYEGFPAVVAFTRDVTERKLLDAQLVKADRMAALGLLSATVAHEINNPLTYVQLGLEVLRDSLTAELKPGADAAQLFSQIAELEAGVRRAASIVKDLRIFARAEALELGSVNVEQVLEQAVRIAENEIRHRARLVRDFACVPPAHGNAASLEQVFLNILVNAAQSVTLGAPTENCITLSLAKHGANQIRVVISDTGCGIPELEKPRIFEPLFTTKPAGVGTGLGLSITRNLLLAQGAEISVESEVGRGTTVTVLLPCFVGAQVPAENLEVTPPARPGVVSVWVVDDEPMIGKLIAQLLVDEHHVRATTSVSEVLKWLAKGDRCDVILCDLMMPGLGGSELYGILKEQWPGLEKRMLIMTGGAFSTEHTDFLAGLDVPALTKPFDLAELRRLIVSMAALPAGAEALPRRQ